MGSKYFGRAGLRVRTLAEDVRAAVSLAVGVDGYLYLYRGGVYVMGRDLIHAEFTSRLDEGYRPSHAAATIDFLTAELRDEGCVLPDAPSGCLLNVRNGMLDLTTRELLDHDPAYLSAVQLPVEWDPDATAPVYERWLRDQAGDQADDLEETASTMLDPGRAPTKAVFLFGPTRSGKSTFLRLMAAIAGRANTSAVTLQHLSSNRFAPRPVARQAAQLRRRPQLAPRRRPRDVQAADRRRPRVRGEQVRAPLHLEAEDNPSHAPVACRAKDNTTAD